MAGQRYRTLRALGVVTFVILGFRFRSTPGFMLAPAPRVLKTQTQHHLI
jgi:hypothetical protein